MCPCEVRKMKKRAFSGLINPLDTTGKYCINYDALMSGDLGEMIKIAYHADPERFNQALEANGLEPVKNPQAAAMALVKISRGEVGGFDRNLPKKILNSLSIRIDELTKKPIGIFC